MKIKSIQFKNFRSYGNKLTTYDFNKSEKILISGVNGSGKTTLIDAIYFNLTGKSNVKLNELINTKNKKDLLTIGEYESSNGTTVKIIRGRKPDTFELYINEVEQDKELSKDFQKKIETILEFTPNNLDRLFLISAINYKPFLKSTPDEKRKLIDSLIEIESLTNISDSAKKDRTIEKESLKSIEFQIDKLKSNIDLINEFNKKIDETPNNKEDELKEIEKRIIDIKQQASELKEQKEKYQKQFDELSKSINELIEKDLKQSKAISNLESIIFKKESSLQTKKEIEYKKIQFLKNNDKCENCDQEINSVHKKNTEWKIEQKLLGYDEEQSEIDLENKKLEKYKEKNTELKNTINDNQKSLKYISDLINRCTIESNKIKIEYQHTCKEKDALKTSISNSITKKDTTQLLKELNEQYDLRLKTIRKIEIIETSIKMLGEKYLRSFMIQRYLPIINESLKKYLEIFGLNFRMILDNEFKESFLRKDYESLGYENLSAGEKKRVDLSLIFAFFDLTKIRIKQSTNVLFLDEIDNSFDQEAIDGLSNILDLLKHDNISTFIITHNSELKNNINFDKHIEIIKLNGFSKISFK